MHSTTRDTLIHPRGIPFRMSLQQCTPRRNLHCKVLAPGLADTLAHLCTGSLNIAWNCGGPVSAIWGWVVVSVMTMTVGLAMAEIVSALPAAGGPYFWASILSGSHGAFFSWITGAPPSACRKHPGLFYSGDGTTNFPSQQYLVISIVRHESGLSSVCTLGHTYPRLALLDI